MKNSIMPLNELGLYHNERMSPYTEKHHIFNKYNRNKSEEDGLFIYLSPEKHRGTNGVHGKNGHELDIYLKKKAQKIWQEYYNKTEDDFRRRYGKSYL